MSRLLGFLLLASALLASFANRAVADGTPRDVVAAAAPPARLTDDTLAGRHWDQVGALIQAEKTCQFQIDAALAAGMRLDQEFELEHVGPIDKMAHTRADPGNAKYWTNLGLIRSFCKA